VKLRDKKAAATEMQFDSVSKHDPSQDESSMTHNGCTDSDDHWEESHTGAEAQKKEQHNLKKELQEKLDKAEQEKKELSERLLRTLAEFDNYKKRVSREKEDLLKYGNEKLAFELLPVLDNFERALEQAKIAQEIGTVVEGIDMMLKQFMSALEKFSIKPFSSVGEPFDPQRHDAMAQQEHPDHEDNTVMAEFQKGYYLSDKLLRPARVIVSKKPEEAPGGDLNSPEDVP